MYWIHTYILFCDLKCSYLKAETIRYVLGTFTLLEEYYDNQLIWQFSPFTHTRKENKSREGTSTPSDIPRRPSISKPFISIWSGPPSCSRESTKQWPISEFGHWRGMLVDLQSCRLSSWRTRKTNVSSTTQLVSMSGVDPRTTFSKLVSRRAARLEINIAEPHAFYDFIVTIKIGSLNPRIFEYPSHWRIDCAGTSIMRVLSPQVVLISHR